MQKINGLINAPFTAFNDDGSINLSVIPRYIEMLVNHGVSGVFVNGSSGEGHLLTDEERMDCAQAWVNAAPENFKVIVHVGSNSVRTSQKLAMHAAEIGAYATSVMGPLFPKINRVEELAAYCEQIASVTPELPFYYYHIPAFTGVNISMLALLKAVDNRILNFAGIKYTFESLYEYTQCRRYENGKYDMLHGQDETLLPSLAFGGATGCIGGTFNYAADLYTGIRKAFAEGDLEKAQQLQYQSLDLIDVIAKFRGNIVAGKQIMKVIGLDLGGNRTPFQNLSDDEFKAMSAELEAINFKSFANKVS
ncbi:MULTISPECIES: dihydrodipicolinate synthase family protein [Pseudoalteromonas]|jgi:N-acetylneuraminate lyase|uniref:dihydrodipicolinate synthase family protein n=1 Tax=Pseudoalteromonas TaxID=53246 RepID=UPI0006D68F6B|nr:MULTISPECIES: dihydrodipicolinate synthase family protein [Pseudoalteromonas]KPZ66924.1 N-acetylneuraminate lyase [Pseudoalteromonas sp. P1-26]MCF2922593.1 dihydrodipicolinate synthase family protein [Pseudoalteromonas sp. APAL1]MDK9685823.1 dihydrodipicolinate synthase family protein [Pseudoalteromonas shioyasakiensis]